MIIMIPKMIIGIKPKAKGQSESPPKDEGMAKRQAIPARTKQNPRKSIAGIELRLGISPQILSPHSGQTPDVLPVKS